jgi:4-amino-4-deoxy-L-arabinose transferase-like glycosyltransferase
MTKEKTVWGIFAILAVALLLRVWGIRFGLPFSYATDEYHEVMRAMQLAAGQFNFNRTGKGGLYFLLSVQYGLYFVALKAMGAVDTTLDFAMNFVRDQTPFYLMGRWLVAVIGTIGVYAVYLLGRKAYSSVAGLFAAALVAVNALHAYESHTINVDIPMVTLATFALLYALKLSESGRPAHYCLAALFAGLATTTKLPALFLAVPLFLAHALFTVRSGGTIRELFLHKGLWTAAGILVGIVIVTNPGIVSRFPAEVMRALQALIPGGDAAGLMDVTNLEDLEDGEFGLGRPNLHVFYLNVLVDSMGWPLVLASVFSVVYAALKRSHADLILLSFVLVLYFLFTGPVAGDMYYGRYFLPIIAIVMVLVGRMFADAYELVRGRGGRALVATAVGMLMVVPIYLSVSQNIALAGPDTRDVAKGWIEENLPNGARVAIEGGKIAPIRTTVQLQDSLEMVERRIGYWSQVEPRQARFLEFRRKVMLEEMGEPGVTFELMLVRPESWRDLAYYRAYGIDYFVIRPEFIPTGSAMGTGKSNLLDQLRADSGATLVYSINRPRPRNRRGGGLSIEVYRVDYGPEESRAAYPDVPVTWPLFTE